MPRYKNRAVRSVFVTMGVVRSAFVTMGVVRSAFVTMGVVRSVFVTMGIVRSLKTIFRIYPHTSPHTSLSIECIFTNSSLQTLLQLFATRAKGPHVRGVPQTLVFLPKH